MLPDKADILIAGAGIIGITLARELVKKGFENIVIIEKEPLLGKHASGRNSGVLHAGIYYTPDSLRAKSCLNGNMLMRQYCRENQIRLVLTEEKTKLGMVNWDDISVQCSSIKPHIYIFSPELREWKKIFQDGLW